ncbi:VOC family protein [Georgenia sunbinii]|uniref:VOC family protein n=1 Tax=Georgenia sunbinii TaxID=3117728 RepID=UPI002F26103C
MNTFDITIAMPTEDRRRAHAFAQALGLQTPGELAEDGVPEPLQVVVNQRARVMYIPTGGFGWVTAERATAEAGTAECLLSISVDSTSTVDNLIRAAGDAGAEVAIQPQQREWGYTGTIADPDGDLWEIMHPAQ